jgi:hypothetical protein
MHGLRAHDITTTTVDGSLHGGVSGRDGRSAKRGEKLPRVPLRLTNVRLPDDELEEARAIARAKGISLGEYIRRAVAVQLAYDRGVKAERREAGGDERQGA